jgi:predicted ferric reductase
VTAAVALSHSKELWYLMRGTGFVALILLTMTMVFGIAGVRRWSGRGWPRAAVALIHRNAALLAVVFLAIHITTAATDPYVSVSWLSAVVPFVSRWSTFWVGLGALALDVMVALVVTSLLRTRMSHRSWRAVHWIAYAAWPLAVAHGLGSGTDSTTGWARVVYVVAVVAVVAAVTWRLRHRLPATPRVIPTGAGPAAPVLRSAGPRPIIAGSRTPTSKGAS